VQEIYFLIYVTNLSRKHKESFRGSKGFNGSAAKLIESLELTKRTKSLQASGKEAFAGFNFLYVLFI
jgi:hypothetical protein